MGNRTETMAARVENFSREVIDYVSQLSDDQWRQTCDWEQWSVGTTARHIGNHLGIFSLAEMVIRGEDLPQWTMSEIDAMSNRDSHEHADCTPAEALALLREKSAGMMAFLKGLADADLDRENSMPAFGGTVTIEQLIDYVVFQSAVKHLASIRQAVGG